MNPIPVPGASAPSSYSFPYDPNEFAARSGEIELVSHKVRALQGKGVHRATRPLVEFYGAMGQGKSWLLAHLRDEFRHKPPEDSPSPPPPPHRPSLSTLVDLQKYHSREQASELLQSLADQLCEQSGAKLILSLDEGDEAAAEALGRHLHDLGSTWVPVLLFDTADQADEEFLDWIESHLIYHAIRDDTVIFVFTGRTRLRWKKFEVRRRVEPKELYPFDSPQTGKQIEQLRGEEPPDEVSAALWSYSFGHPLTTRVIYDTLCRLNPDTPLDAIETRETAIAQAVYDLIENRFLSAVAQSESESESQSRELIWNICVLRKFNVAHLREFVDDKDGTRSEASYLKDIRDLVASTLVRWSSEAGGYVLDPVVRQIVARNLQMREPEQYLKQHRKAVVMYERWIQEHPRNAGDFLIEWMYHQAEIWRAQGISDDKIASQLTQEFQERLDQLRKEPRVQWDLPDVARALDERLLKKGEDTGLKTAVGVLQQTARPFVAKYI